MENWPYSPTSLLPPPPRPKKITLFYRGHHHPRRKGGATDGNKVRLPVAWQNMHTFSRGLLSSKMVQTESFTCEHFRPFIAVTPVIVAVAVWCFWNFSPPFNFERGERERRPKKVFILIGGFARKSSPRGDGRTSGTSDVRTRTVSKGERASETLIVCPATKTTFFRARGRGRTQDLGSRLGDSHPFDLHCLLPGRRAV